ncbi:MAG: hypothetical protein DBY38_10385 [Clostridium cadaveris]|uniref:Uncharacterized protein n=1 Tax=Clostridium cadaveris TaxID=1529 RepID=A0A316M2V4_9CLOT|nr:MAG: hypothetical protein DBY38_10385 [Clostridium cadaveris]
MNNILDLYIHKLLNSNIEEDKMELYIDLFSKFLSYSNPDYKYNGTYLNQYISNFKKVYYALKNKNIIYNKIFMELTGLGKEFELVIDDVYKGVYSLINVRDSEYIGYNQNKIIDDSVEIKLKIKNGEEEYLFCRSYWNLENHILDKVLKDVEIYLKAKGLWRINNETA